MELLPKDIREALPELYANEEIGLAAQALVKECLDAPVAWTLALVARVMGKDVRDLTVIVLDRPRHRDLIREIRAAGARISLRHEGDAEGAIEAALHGSGAGGLCLHLE